MRFVLVRILTALMMSVPLAVFALPPCPAPPFVDDFEPAAEPGWVVDTDLDLNVPSSPWAVGTDPFANSVANSYKTDASGLDEKDDRLIAPPQDLTSTSHLIFWHKFNTEGGFDGGVLEVSTDDGSNWVDVVAGGGVFVAGGYNDVISTGFDSRIAGRPAWTGFSDFIDAMNMVEVDLGAFAGPARLIRWRYVGDPIAIGSVGGDSWAIDDVQFTNLQCDPDPPPGENVCVSPGLTILEDPAGDAATGSPPAHDIIKLSIAEPYDVGPGKVMFVLKMAGLGTVPPDTTWPILFRSPDGVDYAARMDTVVGGQARFTVATGANSTNAAVNAGTAADPASDFSADGTIRIVVPRAAIGDPLPGEQLTQFLIRIRQEAGAVALVPDSAPDDLVRTGAHEVAGNETFCAPNAAPVATLTADPLSGDAPLTVTFTVSGSDADNDALSYTLDFDDGQKLENQSFDGQSSLTVMHTYQNGGDYAATLTVTDADNAVSNPAETLIEIVGPPVANAGEDSDVNEGATATLNGADSSDGNSGPLSYAWTQQSGPAMTLDDPTSVSPSFIAPATCAGIPLVFRLTVANQAGTSFDDTTVTVQNINALPVANAGANFTVDRGAGVTLSGEGSTDADACQTLSYAWTQDVGPLVALANANTVTPSFTAPQASTDTKLRFRLDVTDSAGGSSNDEIIVTVRSQVPVTVTGDARIFGSGSLSSLSLLILGLLGLLGPRRRG